jgi:hypothetical protein
MKNAATARKSAAIGNQHTNGIGPSVVPYIRNPSTYTVATSHNTLFLRLFPLSLHFLSISISPAEEYLIISAYCHCVKYAPTPITIQIINPIAKLNAPRQKNQDLAGACVNTYNAPPALPIVNVFMATCANSNAIRTVSIFACGTFISHFLLLSMYASITDFFQRSLRPILNGGGIFPSLIQLCRVVREICNISIILDAFKKILSSSLILFSLSCFDIYIYQLIKEVNNYIQKIITGTYLQINTDMLQVI